MGYQPSFKFLDTVKNSAPFNFEKYSIYLARMLLNDQRGWLKSNAEDILNDILVDTPPHDSFKYFAGTKESQISFAWFFECLNLLEIHPDPERVSEEICLPVELVSYWYENAKQLSQLTSQKNNPRLFDLNNKNLLEIYLKPSMVDTREEHIVMKYFFENIQKTFEKEPDKIKDVLETFLSRVTISHTGIHYQWNKIDQLELFYSKVKDLFPSQYWHLLGKDLVKLLDSKKQPLLLKLAKSNTIQHPTTQEDYVRLQLYSPKERRALAAFKFCLHLACIGRPKCIKFNPNPV